MIESLLPVTHPSGNYRILPLGSVCRASGLEHCMVTRYTNWLFIRGLSRLPLEWMPLLSLRRCLKLLSWEVKWNSTFSAELKNIFLPSASLPSLGWHRTLPDTVFSAHIEDLLTPPIRSLCQLISCFQTIYLFLSQLLFAGSFCLLFLAGSPTQCLGVKLFIFILSADFHSSLSTHAFSQFQKIFVLVSEWHLSTH